MNASKATVARIAVLALLAPVAAAALGPAPLLKLVSGTSALYQMDETTGTAVADSSGNNRNGTLTGAATFVTGLNGGAIDFNGTFARLDVNVPLGSTWTIQGWSLFPLSPTGGTWWSLAENGPNLHHVFINRASGVLGTYRSGWNPSSNGDYPSGFDTRTLSGWHLVTAVGTGGHTSYYIDDKAVGECAVQNTESIRAIGNHYVAEGPFNWGVIDGVRILSVERSAAEIAQDYQESLVPAVPDSLAQVQVGGAALAVGAAVGSGLILQGRVSDPGSESVRLDVEVKPVGTAFSGLPADIVSGTIVSSGSVASIPLPGLAPGTAYHWQARATDAGGKSSAWVSFGGNAETAADFSISSNLPPSPAATLQLSALDGSLVSRGGRVFGSSVTFESPLLDGNGNTVRLEVEVRSAGTTLTGEAVASSELVPSGSLASVTVNLDPGFYHWQGRAVDQHGLTSAWTSVAGGAPAERDFELQANGSVNSAACAAPGAGAGPALALLALLAAAGFRR